MESRHRYKHIIFWVLHWNENMISHFILRTFSSDGVFRWQERHLVSHDADHFVLGSIADDSNNEQLLNWFKHLRDSIVCKWAVHLDCQRYPPRKSAEQFVHNKTNKYYEWLVSGEGWTDSVQLVHSNSDYLVSNFVILYAVAVKLCGSFTLIVTDVKKIQWYKLFVVWLVNKMSSPHLIQYESKMGNGIFICYKYLISFQPLHGLDLLQLQVHFT